MAAEKEVKRMIRFRMFLGSNYLDLILFCPPFRENKILEENDILMISHLDELPSRESVYLAKHCHMKSPIVYGALIMPMGNFNFAFRSFYTLVVRFVKLNYPSSIRSDYPVPGKPHSFSHHIKFAQVLSVNESLFDTRYKIVLYFSGRKNTCRPMYSEI